MPVWQHSQQSSSSVQNIPNHSQIHLNEINIFKFLLERLFWFTWQRSRISWTCGTGNKQCKFRQNIKWIGLENCRINNMRLKCLLRSTYSCFHPCYCSNSYKNLASISGPINISSSIDALYLTFFVLIYFFLVETVGMMSLMLTFLCSSATPQVQLFGQPARVF